MLYIFYKYVLYIKNNNVFNGTKTAGHYNCISFQKRPMFYKKKMLFSYLQ